MNTVSIFPTWDGRNVGPVHIRKKSRSQRGALRFMDNPIKNNP